MEGHNQIHKGILALKQKNSIKLNQWNQIIVTFDNGLLKLYLNGNLEENSTLPYPTLDYSYLETGNSTSTNFIGAHYPVSPSITNYMNGNIDDFSIWNRALTSLEIQQLYTQSQSSYLWSTGETTPSINVTPTVTTKYFVTKTDGATISKDSVTITVQDPTATITASGPTTFCEGGSVTLTASSGNSYLWSNGATSQSITVNTAGDYNVTVQTSAGCTATSSNVTVITEKPTVGQKYSTLVAIKNKPITLNARSINNVSSYRWIPNTGLDNEFTKQPVFNHDKGQFYLIELTTTGGCVTIDSLIIKILDKPEIFVPKGFSPNGDGHNDVLKPYLSGLDQLKFFKVFNRWGILIYETNILGEGWDGFYRGEKQPFGSYTWLAQGQDDEGEIINSQGTTVLLR
jgi:gliding motility-associated-like protein